MNSLYHYINEGYYKRNTMDEWYELLRNKHKKSSYVEDWIKSVQGLLDGSIEELPRNHFKVRMGKQYGYEWLDSLVEYGFLTKVKKGRKEYILSPDSKEGKQISITKDVEEMIADVRNRESMYGNPDNILFNWNEKNEEWEFSIQDWVLTWLHYEKGYGETQSKSDIKQNEKNIEDTLNNWYLIKFILKKYKDIFGKGKFTITSKDVGNISTFGRDSHKGYLYKVTGKITK